MQFKGRPLCRPNQPSRLSNPREFSSTAADLSGPDRVWEADLPEHPAVHWIVPTEGDPGEPLLADGVIYVGDRSETLYAISLSDGSIRWRTRGLGFVYCAPPSGGETVYVPSHGLTAYLKRDGKVLWNRVPGIPPNRRP